VEDRGGLRASGAVRCHSKSVPGPDKPPPYDPGGLTCIVDDFTVADPALWATVGSTCSPVTRAAADRGAGQVVVVTAARDDPKRAALDRCGLTAASDWRVTPTTAP